MWRSGLDSQRERDEAQDAHSHVLRPTEHFTHIRVDELVTALADSGRAQKFLRQQV